MRDKYEEMQGQLNALADWIETTNHLHCDSVPRRAADTIRRLEEENYQMWLKLNKRDLTLSDIVNRIVGRVRLVIYLMRKRYGHR